MLRIFLALFLLTGNAFAANEWRGGSTEQSPPGTTAINDIDTVVYQHMTDPLDRLLSNYRQGMFLTYSSTSTLVVGVGEVTCSNAAGTVRKFRSNTSTTNVTFSDIDTGAEGSSTTYYVYAVCDADATTATFKVSLSSTSPTGVTYYKRLGSFYNNASSNIENIFNDNYSALPTSNGTSYSAGTTYQNTSTSKIQVIWYGHGQRSGGWVAAKQLAYIGETSSPATQVAGWHYEIPGSAYMESQCGSFIVPSGWYWKITNEATIALGFTGTIDKIETFNID